MKKTASNKQIKEWRKLLMGKYRKKTGQFLAEGLRCVEQILQNRLIEVTAVLSDGSGAIDQLNVGTIPVFELYSDDFVSVSDTETPQGIIAVCRMPDEITVDEISQSKGLIVALDAIQDPGNLGTIIRTAAWFGVKAILFGTGCADPFHPKVVRSTAGSTGTIPFMKGDLGPIFSDLESSGWQVCLLDGSDEVSDLRDVKPANKTILVAGNEAGGINPELFTSNRISVRIDGDSGTVESLNVATALGIGLFRLTYH